MSQAFNSVFPVPAPALNGQAPPVKLDQAVSRHSFHGDPVWEFIEEVWGEVPTFVPVAELLIFLKPLLTNE